MSLSQFVPSATVNRLVGKATLESCARTCEQEGSWFKHASGRRYDGLPGPWVYFSAYDHVPKIVERSFVPVVDISVDLQ